MNDHKIPVLFGPTASGKSSLALALAKELRAEILNMDSMQIYREMNIGTAKPTAAEMKEIPNHLYNVASITEDFSVARYRDLAMACIRKLQEQGKTPLLVGGTGLYLSSLYYDFEFRPKEPMPFSEEEKAALLEEAEGIDIRNPHRLQRYLETGQHHSKKDRKRSDLDMRIFSLERPREEIYERIHRRIDQMMEEGLLEEVEILFADPSLTDTSPLYKGIGYKEFLPFLRGENSLESCVEELKKNTRNYAKRQMTWIRHQYDNVIALDASKPPEELIRQVKSEMGVML